MSLDENSFIPLYYQLAEELRENIESGEWTPHSLIPSETEFCEKYTVSRGTVRQALSQLVQEGLLYRKQGKGTFVAEPKTAQQLNRFHSFAQDIRGRGLKPYSQVLQNVKLVPKSSIKDILGLKEGEVVFKIVGLKMANKEPLILEISYFVEKLLPDLNKLSKEEMEKVPLYNFFIEKCGVKITGVKETFEPFLAGKFEAEKLHIPPGSLSLLVKRITYTADAVPFEFRRIVVRSDKCRYLVKFIYGAGTLDLQL